MFIKNIIRLNASESESFNFITIVNNMTKPASLVNILRKIVIFLFVFVIKYNRSIDVDFVRDVLNEKQVAKDALLSKF